MKEYMVHIWGGAFNSDANPSIEKDHGVTEGYYYFSTQKEKDDFIALISEPKYSDQGLISKVIYGDMSHKRTIFVATFEYLGKEFIIHYDFGYEFEENQALFIFLSGNYSCDCNRSQLIQQEYGDTAIPKLNCDNRIRLVRYHFEYKE